jgi:hypothetical protein
VAKNFPLPWRQIHLDFHTGPAIPDVGRDFNAREFARTMKRAGVTSVTVFAKCHHGHLYYATKRPERHPGLKAGLDLTRRQVEALHAEGIRAPIYISVQCDEYAANTHPEWVARRPDSSMVAWRGDGKTWFAPGWQILDMSSPYQEYLAEQTAEVLRLLRPVDGIFFDMCWDQPSSSQHAIAGMRRAGLDPASEADRQTYAHAAALAYMDRYYRMVRASAPEATVYFNSRSYFNLGEEVRWQSQVEIEALPTGGWGYMFFPRVVRFGRQFGRPYLGMTARFHKSWADFGGLKPYAALEYETSQMMAHGAHCSIGDQLHPRGRLDAAAYDLIGRIYARVAEREPWLEGARPVTEIGLFQAPAPHLRAIETTGTDEGATRMLTQLRHQFDVVHAGSDLDAYSVLVLPDCIAVDAALARRLRAFLKRGGRILATGVSGLTPDSKALALPELGVSVKGPSPYSVTYIRFGKEIAAGVPPTDHVMYERGVRVLPARGAKALARVVEPYFERTWDHFSSHRQTPPDKVSPYAAAVQKGGVIYIPFPIFAAYAQHGSVPYRLLVGNLLARLLPEPLLCAGGPTGLETSVMRQKGRTIVHLLQYCPERRATNLDLIEDIVPIHNVPLSLRLARRPRRVYFAPSRAALPFEYVAGRAAVTLPEVCGHAMVVLE